MNDAKKREKVIRGLEVCACDSRLMQCANCPYQTDKSRCVTTLMRDALALLKEQEARVMTLEELDDYRKTEEGADPYITSEKTPVMVEYRGSNDPPNTTLTIELLNLWLDYRDLRVMYGKDWRAWSARPTEEQRKAVAWEPLKEEAKDFPPYLDYPIKTKGDK